MARQLASRYASLSYTTPSTHVCAAHVHFHLLPRKLKGDRFSENNDAVYPALEKSEASLSEPLKVDADEDRVPRTLKEMEKEAEWLSSFFETDEFNDI